MWLNRRMWTWMHFIPHLAQQQTCSCSHAVLRVSVKSLLLAPSAASCGFVGSAALRWQGFVCFIGCTSLCGYLTVWNCDRDTLRFSLSLCLFPPPLHAYCLSGCVGNRMLLLASAASVTHGTAVTSRDSSPHIQCGGNLRCLGTKIEVRR